MNPNFKKNNLKAQKAADKSTFKLYQSLIKLRKLPVFKYGDLKMTALDETSVIGYVRWVSWTP